MSESGDRPASVDASKALVDRFFRDVLNAVNPSAIDDVVASDCVLHHPVFGKVQGADPIASVIDGFRAGFSDLRYVVEDEVAEADKVVARWVAAGTHDGTFAGIPATHKPVVVGGTDVFRVFDGRIAEIWVSSDIFGLFGQLGKFPPPPGQPPA